MVIDQADESEICRHLPSYLKRCLKNKDVRGLRLLLACRTGDYPSGLRHPFSIRHSAVVPWWTSPRCRGPMPWRSWTALV